MLRQMYGFRWRLVTKNTTLFFHKEKLKLLTPNTPWSVTLRGALGFFLLGVWGLGFLYLWYMGTLFGVWGISYSEVRVPVLEI